MTRRAPLVELLNLDKFKVIAEHALADILPPIDLESVARWEAHRLGFEDFSLPDLVLFALTRLRGIKGLGRGEKIAWSVDACFRDIPFQIALRKRGFELDLPEGTPEEARKELVRHLKKASGIAARCLRDTGQQQIEAGNVTIDNRFLVFEGAYRFFRTEAETRFKIAKTGVAALFDPKVREAGYFAGAMINAYFSRLEHALVLAMAFTSFDPTKGALRKFAEKSLGRQVRCRLRLGDGYLCQTRSRHIRARQERSSESDLTWRLRQEGDRFPLSRSGNSADSCDSVGLRGLDRKVCN
jgi:hypothetical protein